MMKAIDKRRYVELSKNENEAFPQLLIYGKNERSSRNDLVVVYSVRDGIQKLYHLKSVLTKEQITTVRQWIADFNPKYEVQL